MSHNAKHERNDRIYRDVKSGMSHKRACAKYDLSPGRLNAIVRAHPEFKSKRVGSTARNAEIVKLCRQGLPQNEVAARFGVTRSAVAAAVARSRPKDPTRIPRPRANSAGARAATEPTKEQIEADRKLIADFIKAKGVRVCPTVALVPTQAVLMPNPGIDDRWNGSTGWPASDQVMRAKKATRARALACA